MIKRKVIYHVVGQKWNDNKDNKGHRIGWVCKYCGSKTITIYIATSHDHTDERVNICTCGKGERFQDVWPRITRGIYPTYNMNHYIEYFS